MDHEQMMHARGRDFFGDRQVIVVDIYDVEGGGQDPRGSTSSSFNPIPRKGPGPQSAPGTPGLHKGGKPYMGYKGGGPAGPGPGPQGLPPREPSQQSLISLTQTTTAATNQQNSSMQTQSQSQQQYPSSGQLFNPAMTPDDCETIQTQSILINSPGPGGPSMSQSQSQSLQQISTPIKTQYQQSNSMNTNNMNSGRPSRKLRSSWDDAEDVSNIEPSQLGTAAVPTTSRSIMGESPIVSSMNNTLSNSQTLGRLRGSLTSSVNYKNSAPPPSMSNQNQYQQNQYQQFQQIPQQQRRYSTVTGPPGTPGPPHPQFGTPGPYIHGYGKGPPPQQQRPRRRILERWILSFAGNNGFTPHQDPPMQLMNRRLDERLMRKLSVSCRSIYCLVRLLPCFELYRKKQTQLHMDLSFVDANLALRNLPEELVQVASSLGTVFLFLARGRQSIAGNGPTINNNMGMNSPGLGLTPTVPNPMGPQQSNSLLNTPSIPLQLQSQLSVSTTNSLKDASPVSSMASVSANDLRANKNTVSTVQQAAAGPPIIPTNQTNANNIPTGLVNATQTNTNATTTSTNQSNLTIHNQKVPDSRAMHHLKNVEQEEKKKKESVAEMRRKRQEAARKLQEEEEAATAATADSEVTGNTTQNLNEDKNEQQKITNRNTDNGSQPSTARKSTIPKNIFDDEPEDQEKTEFVTPLLDNSTINNLNHNVNEPEPQQIQQSLLYQSENNNLTQAVTVSSNPSQNITSTLSSITNTEVLQSQTQNTNSLNQIQNLSLTNTDITQIQCQNSVTDSPKSYTGASPAPSAGQTTKTEFFSMALNDNQDLDRESSTNNDNVDNNSSSSSTGNIIKDTTDFLTKSLETITAPGVTIFNIASGNTSQNHSKDEHDIVKSSEVSKSSSDILNFNDIEQTPSVPLVSSCQEDENVAPGDTNNSDITTVKVTMKVESNGVNGNDNVANVLDSTESSGTSQNSLNQNVQNNKSAQQANEGVDSVIQEREVAEVQQTVESCNAKADHSLNANNNQSLQVDDENSIQENNNSKNLNQDATVQENSSSHSVSIDINKTHTSESNSMSVTENDNSTEIQQQGQISSSEQYPEAESGNQTMSMMSLMSNTVTQVTSLLPGNSQLQFDPTSLLRGPTNQRLSAIEERTDSHRTESQGGISNTISITLGSNPSQQLSLFQQSKEADSQSIGPIPSVSESKEASLDENCSQTQQSDQQNQDLVPAVMTAQDTVVDGNDNAVNNSSEQEIVKNDSNENGIDIEKTVTVPESQQVTEKNVTAASVLPASAIDVAVSDSQTDSHYTNQTNNTTLMINSDNIMSTSDPLLTTSITLEPPQTSDSMTLAQNLNKIPTLRNQYEVEQMTMNCRKSEQIGEKPLGHHFDRFEGASSDGGAEVTSNLFIDSSEEQVTDNEGASLSDKISIMKKKLEDSDKRNNNFTIKGLESDDDDNNQTEKPNQTAAGFDDILDPDRPTPRQDNQQIMKTPRDHDAEEIECQQQQQPLNKQESQESKPVTVDSQGRSESNDQDDDLKSANQQSCDATAAMVDGESSNNLSKKSVLSKSPTVTGSVSKESNVANTTTGPTQQQQTSAAAAAIKTSNPQFLTVTPRSGPYGIPGSKAAASAATDSVTPLPPPLSSNIFSGFCDENILLNNDLEESDENEPQDDMELVEQVDQFLKVVKQDLLGPVPVGSNTSINMGNSPTPSNLNPRIQIENLSNVGNQLEMIFQQHSEGFIGVDEIRSGMEKYLCSGGSSELF